MKTCYKSFILTFSLSRNYFEPNQSKLGSPYGEISRLEQLMDEFHKFPTNKIQYQKATEFAIISKRRIEHELFTPPHYRNFEFIIRMIKCYALVWKNSESVDSVRSFMVDQGVLESIFILLSDSTSTFQLKYVISGLLKAFSTSSQFQQWISKGNGIRSILQVFSHFYEETSEFISSIFEYQQTIHFLYQILLSLSTNEYFVQSLFHILRFQRVSELYNLPVILTKAITFHCEKEILQIILKFVLLFLFFSSLIFLIWICLLDRLIERFACVYGPSGSYLHSNMIQKLVQLLDNTSLFYETACVLRILLLPEYQPTSGDIDVCMKGCMALLTKHLILSAPNSLRIERAHFDCYGFVISQLAHHSYVY